MADLGSKPSFNDWAWYGYGSGVYNQVFTSGYTMPVDGVFTSVSFYADSDPHTGSTPFKACLWVNGSLVAISSPVTLGAGSETVGGQTLHTFGISSTYVAAGSTVQFGWWRDATSGSMLYSYQTGGAGYLKAVGGTASGTSGGTSLGGAIEAYGTYTQVVAPSATTDAATSIATTSATLNGAVNDNGLAADGGGSSTVFFNLSTTPSGGSSIPAGTITGAASVSAFATGLTPGLTYYYQVVITNSGGTAYGSWVSFTTLGAPSATTGAATGVYATEATLNGAVTDGGYSGGATNCSFSLSTSPTGASPTAVTSTPSSFTGSASPTAPVSSLAPSTTYYYQVVASNGDGTAGGAWVAFTTLAGVTAPPPSAILLLLQFLNLLVTGNRNFPVLQGAANATLTAGSADISTAAPFFPTNDSGTDYSVFASGLGTVTLPPDTAIASVTDSQHAVMTQPAGGSGSVTTAILTLQGLGQPAYGASMQPNTFSLVSPLNIVQNWAISEGGFVFPDRLGVLQIFPRKWLQTQKQNYPMGQITFTDVGQGDGGPYGYTAISMDSAIMLFFNQVQGIANNPTTPPGTVGHNPATPLLQKVNDLVSQSQYQQRTLLLPGLELLNDTDVSALVSYFLGLYSEPEIRFDTVQLELQGLSSSDQAIMSSLELLTLAVVVRTPPGGGAPISILSAIENINWQFDSSTKTCKLTLSMMSLTALPTP